MIARKAFVLLLLAVCQAYGSGLLDVGPAECARGIDVWCQDLDSARECGAVSHCIQNVWEQKTLPKDKSEICDLCKQMVQEARDQLQSNETQEEIKEVLEGTCKIYFPIKSISKKCIEIVDDYIPDLIDELSSMMDPQMVCATAGICNSFKFLTKLGVKKIVKAPNQCDECVDTAAAAISKLQNETDAQFKDTMKKICHMAPGSIQEPCNLAVDMYYKQMKTSIGDLKPKELCQLGGLCDGLNGDLNFKIIMLNGDVLSKPKAKSPECDFCKQMVLHLRDLLLANSTEQEVKDTLLSLCGQMGGFSDTCKNLVNEYFYEIYNFLNNELDPEAICNALGICTAGSSSVPMVLLEAASQTGRGRYRIVGKDESNSIDWEKNRQKPENIQLPETRLMPQILIPFSAHQNQLVRGNEKISCALCEYALRTLLNMLKDNKTEVAIKNALDQLCARLPTTLTKECEDYVRDYSDLIIQLLEQEVDPDVMCVQLGLCKGAADTVTPILIQDASDKFPNKFPSLKVKFPKTKHHVKSTDGVGEITKCEVCNLLVSYVDSMLEDQPTEEAIVHALDNACGLLPKSVYADCRSIVDVYGEYILQYIGTLANSKQVCQAIDLCPRVAGQVHLLGGDKCTYGPSYWCQSIHHAKACKAEEHCKNKVWN